MIRIGTRGSKLALAQTDKVMYLLEENGVEAERVIIQTKGDAVTDRGLHQIGGYGVFVRELDNAILSGEIDAAVHSMKDIPAERPAGLVTAAVLKRDPPFDFLVADKSLDEMFVIGTSSLRRHAQILRYYHHHPDIQVKPLRGNIDTRLEKLHAGEFDAIVLSEAGLARLGYFENGFRLPANAFVPSPNQGTIAVVSRDLLELREVFAPLNDEASAWNTAIERAVMEELGGGCFIPQGIYCQGGRLLAEVLSLDGMRAERVTEDNLSVESAREVGKLLRQKAGYLIQEALSVCEGKQ